MDGMDGMDAIVREFLGESFENLDQLDRDVVALEESPSDREIFGRIFRTVHTIKGTCGFLSFHRLEAVTHAGESVLAKLRDGSLELDPEITSTLLRLFDAVRTMLGEIDRSGTEGDEEYGDVIRDLERWAGEKKKRLTTDTVSASEVEVDATSEHGIEVPDQGEAEPDTDDRRPVQVPTTAAMGETSLRVDVRVLDHLMNLVGELVLARNQILQLAPAASDPGLGAAAQRLDGLTGALQDAVMRTRMQPIRSVWSKLPRFVRDLAVTSGKKVELRMSGQDTDLDKSVIEAIRGSLLHLVRNAVDHGIEAPEVRVAAGKPESGMLSLAAAHEGGNVVIEVDDDGGGLDLEAILRRAVEVGVVRPDEALGLSDREIEMLIFRPGFSTALTVTEVSGRGVGMDVVRSSIESIGGSIEIRSEPGRSTSFRLKIPLTLAIVPVLLVRCRGARFAVPQVGVVELVKLDRDQDSLGVERLHGVPVFRLRDQLLPLVDLAQELGTGDDGTIPAAGTIVVLQTSERLFGLVVDAVDDSQEIVVKGLGRLLTGLPYVGATILGDGGVALILDVVRLGLAAGVVSDAHQHAGAGDEPTANANATVEGLRPETLLCLRGPDDERYALPFEHVIRLEAILVSRVEMVAGRPVLQYRDEILDLVELEQVLPERRRERRTPLEPDPTGALQVVVCELQGRRLGLVVHRILDIVHEVLPERQAASRDGVSACIVLRERVTELLDLEALAVIADPGFLARGAKPKGGRRD
jgi:two-component system chemotaxis sensor kinase CheA